MDTALAAPYGDLSGELVEAPVWTDEMVSTAGIPVHDVPFVTVGGGIGSFVTVDYLRIYGVPATDMRVLSNIDTPWETYEYLTRVSQIPAPDRIRSDSSSRPDNMWGFPSYALEEAWRERSLKHVFQVVVEPLLADYWTPRVATVFRTMEREARRISYWDMLVKGQVRLVRKRAGGGYFTLLAVPSEETEWVAFRSRFVHLAVGYAGLRFLPDLQDFREHHRDYHHVVNAYERHEHVYESLKSRPGVVVVRGSGIVASRVLQRLMDDREKYGLRTQIVHIFRTFVTGSHGPGPWMRRKGGDGWAYQGFNYPKSVWGGQLKAQMSKLEGGERAQLYRDIGGTSTPWRRRWQRQLRDGRWGGWYHPLQGRVDKVEPGREGRVVTRLRGDNGRISTYESDYIIDCTGMEVDIAEHGILADLLGHGGAYRNPLGRLEIERHFEVKGTANLDGALYASGAATLGGYFPGVDTFLGLQIAAQEIADDLARRGFCRRLGPVRSTAQWLRWVLNRRV